VVASSVELKKKFNEDQRYIAEMLAEQKQG
jgi:hypothetical protein